MSGSQRRRPARLRGWRGSRGRAVDRGRGSRAAPRGTGWGPQWVARARDPSSGRARRASAAGGFPAETPSLCRSSPGPGEGVSGLRSGAVVWGSRPRGAGLAASRGRGRLSQRGPEVGSCFRGATLAGGQEEFFLCLCTFELLAREGVGIRCVSGQVFPPSEPLRCVGVTGRSVAASSLLTSFNLGTAFNYLRADCPDSMLFAFLLPAFWSFLCSLAPPLRKEEEMKQTNQGRSFLTT